MPQGQSGRCAWLLALRSYASVIKSLDVAVFGLSIDRGNWTTAADKPYRLS
jgi:hypothetical protein